MLDSAQWCFRLDRRRWRARWMLTGQRPEPRPGMIGLYEQPAADRDDIGICCSGGGIRSAAFNLGALQTLQDSDLLDRASYLTAVSGGSYIAAAFSMVAQTWRRWDEGTDDSDPALVNDDAPPFEPGSPEEQYLRNHLGYLAPDGLARLYLVMRMLTAMLVNTLLIGLPVFVAGLLVGWFARDSYGHLSLSTAQCRPDGGCTYTAVIPDPVWITIGALGALALGLALVDVLWRPKRDVVRIAVETWELRFLLLAAAGAIVLVAVPWLAARGLTTRGAQPNEAPLASGGAALSSLAALAVAAIGHVRGRVRDEKAAIEGVSRRLGRFARPVRDALIATAVLLAGPLLLLAIAVLGVLVAVTGAPHHATLPVIGTIPSATLVLAGSAAVLFMLWLLVDVTSVSLHPFYRRRLATAFALKRVWVDEHDAERPAPTDPAAQAAGRIVARQRDFDRLVPLSRSGLEAGSQRVKRWPMLVVCAAANVSDPGVTPPGRAVTSFTFSPSAIGGPVTAAAPTAHYEQDLGRNRQRDVTLPAAVAMSGAALSPAMGKLTYRPLKFLLALANIRLGVWVPNPAYINERHDQPRSFGLLHRPRARYLWKEVLGRNRLEDKFLYVTDGGHYENLGLVELLRRGCRTIYCFDAGGGVSSRSLGDAIALARAELDVEIVMEPEAADLAEDPVTHRAARCCARGRISYPAAEGEEPVTGTLIYVRSTIDPATPWELVAFREADATFPHHSTLDQFFDDQKFEAYRRLGRHAAAQALALEPLHAPPAGVLALSSGG
jgi:hypothetical protein